MTDPPAKILLCNCEKTMALDGKALARARGEADAFTVHTQLCRMQLEAFSRALEGERPVLVACTQEAPLFRELAEEAGRADRVGFFNIRERAGWTAEKSPPTAKYAALIEEAVNPATPARALTLTSDGMCLVYGKGEAAMDAARRLSATLNVTLLLQDAGDVTPPAVVDVPVYKGAITRLSGHFGAFDVIVDGYAPAIPSSRASLQFAMPRDGAASRCAIVFDMSGGQPLLTQPERRDGYFHIDPDDRAGLAEAMLEAASLVGEFEKPIYITYRDDICAHSRSGKIGCNACIDACPLSAVTHAGDTVAFDAAVCGGCGACAALCPTGAASYSLPARPDAVTRASAMLGAYRSAGGANAHLLVHDERHGAEMISMLARFGKGLPGHVLPFAVNETGHLGHDFLLACLALGYERLTLIIDPRRADESDGLRAQVALADAIVAAIAGDDDSRLTLFDEADPDGLEALLWAKPAGKPLATASIAGSGDKRELARLAVRALNEAAASPVEVIALDGLAAPYGRIEVDAEGCTLCLACVSACPMGAIRDNPERPQLRFVEQACVQCGLCRNTCPEKVIALMPRLDLTNAALSPVVLHEEEPAECVRCGKPFGVKSSVERIVAQLAGKHAMFKDKAAQELIRMCDDCRVIAQSESAVDPFAAGPRPPVRTADDYLIDDDEEG